MRISPSGHDERLELREPGRFLTVARIVKPQGRRGEVAAEILTDFPERFAKLHRVYLEGSNGAAESFELEAAWPHKGRIILKISGVNSIDDAERLRGNFVLIPHEEKTALPAGSYFVWELEGCRVMRITGGVEEEIGTVTDVERTGGADLLHVAGARTGRELLIPLAEAICRRIDTKAKAIWIDPPEDLLDLNA
jgi:16S rRNA processing protein RimM